MRVKPLKVAFASVIAGFALMGITTQASAAQVSLDLYAEPGIVQTPDGGQVYSWGFSEVPGKMRYPGPTIRVVEGDVVTVSLTNHLPDPDGSGPKVEDPVSLVFAGQEGLKFSTDNVTFVPVEPFLAHAGAKDSLESLVQQAQPGATVYYQFTAASPGTFHYFSGTSPHKHIDMGLVGPIVVEPLLGPTFAYNDASTVFDAEYMQFLSAMDPDQHLRVEAGEDYQATAYLPQYWFINGRAFPDTLSPDNLVFLPTQPDGAIIGMYPGESILFRVVNVDRQVHPMHHHGNHARVVGENGTPLIGGSHGDLTRDRFTQTVFSGESAEAIFTWNPEDPALPDFGWDIFGKDLTGPGGVGGPDGIVDRPTPVEVAPTVDNPNIGLNYGDAYSGSPYLGQSGLKPGGCAGLCVNAHGENFVPYHSHEEHELQNQGQGLGGMLTVIMICDPGIKNDPNYLLPGGPSCDGR